MLPPCKLTVFSSAPIGVEGAAMPALVDLCVTDAYGRRWLSFTFPVKRCGRCRLWLPHEMFTRDRKLSFGLNWLCRNCCGDAQKRYRIAVRQKPPLTIERLRELLLYDPTAGIFTRRIAMGNAPAGAAAGYVSTDGYRYIKIDGRKYGAGRLVIMFMTGELPVNEVDHWNLDKADDRFDNLRPATHSQNMANIRPRGKLRLKGVYQVGSKFRAMIMHRRLGTFPSADLASEAYEVAAVAEWGAFARIG
jgi:hypothetical protein